MIDQQKLTADDVLRLQNEANRMPPETYLNARRTLQQSVALGPAAFADDAAFSHAKHLVDTFFPMQ